MGQLLTSSCLYCRVQVLIFPIHENALKTAGSLKCADDPLSLKERQDVLKCSLH